MDKDKLLIADDYEAVKDFPLSHKILLERDYRQLRANREFDTSRTAAMAAGGTALVSALAAVSIGSTGLIGALPVLFFANSSIKHFGKGTQHAARAAEPDSAIQHAIHEYEWETNPGKVLLEAWHDGRVIEEPALVRA